MDCNTPAFSVLHYLPEFVKFMPIEQSCYLTISSSVTLFSFCLSSFPASGSFPMSWLFTSGGQSIGASASASVLSMNISFRIHFIRIHWFDLLAVQGTLKSLLQHNLKASIIWCAASFMAQFSHPNMTTGKATALTIQTIVSKEMSLLFNMLSRFVIAFPPRRKYLLISWLQSPSVVMLEPKKINLVTASTFSPSICHVVMEPNVMILVFLMLSFKPVFSFSSFTFTKRLFNSSSFSSIRVFSFRYLRWLIFLLEILIPPCDSSSPAFHKMCSARRSKQSILKETSPEYSLKGRMLKLKLQYFGHPM